MRRKHGKSKPTHTFVCLKLIFFPKSTLVRSKENTVLRSRVPPDRVSVVPNAVDCARFLPQPSLRPAPPTINIVVMSRLVYRKGVDLLLDVVPRVRALCCLPSDAIC